MTITDRILETIKELATEKGVNEDEIKYFHIANRLAKKLNDLAKDNEALDLVSLCTYVVKDFEDGLNYMNNRGEWTKHKQFAKIYAETEAKTIAKINEARTKLYKG